MNDANAVTDDRPRKERYEVRLEPEVISMIGAASGFLRCRPGEFIAAACRDKYEKVKRQISNIGSST